MIRRCSNCEWCFEFEDNGELTREVSVLWWVYEFLTENEGRSIPDPSVHGGDCDSWEKRSDSI